jgi:hypothetical protein
MLREYETPRSTGGFISRITALADDPPSVAQDGISIGGKFISILLSFVVANLRRMQMIKKWWLITLMTFVCSLSYAGYPEKSASLSSKVILQNTQGYFVLSDGSCWKVVAFSKRWRSLSEWWHDVQLVPKNYECAPSDWSLGVPVEVYAKFENLEIDEANASNQDVLRQCTHLFVNPRTSQVLFAISLEPAECMVNLFTEARDEGYAQGFVEGRAKGEESAVEVYNRGYRDGHKIGYTEGMQTAQISQPVYQHGGRSH